MFFIYFLKFILMIINIVIGNVLIVNLEFYCVVFLNINIYINFLFLYFKD